MTKYTVIAATRAEDELAQLWLQASDRAAVARAADTIDQMLREDATVKGFDSAFGVRQLIVSPLVAEFTVNELDRIVTVWAFRHIGDLANGH